MQYVVKLEDSMKISYSLVITWLTRNWRILVACEILCILIASIYLAIAPRIYEANFSVRLPKMQITSPADPLRQDWKLMLSGLEYMRGIQNPMTFSNVFIQECMGEDSNANRRKFVNSSQISLLNNADVLNFSLRIEGRENVIRCSNLLQARVLDDLNGAFDIQLLKDKSSLSPALAYEKPIVSAAIRESDGFIQPRINKVISAALIAGIFLTLFAVSLRAKYRA